MLRQWMYHEIGMFERLFGLAIAIPDVGTEGSYQAGDVHVSITALEVM